MNGQYSQAGDLLAHSPGVLEELPAWFAGLDGRQLRSVWVAAVIEALQDEDANDAGWPIKQLAAALTAVRDHTEIPVPSRRKRGMAIRQLNAAADECRRRLSDGGAEVPLADVVAQGLVSGMAQRMREQYLDLSLRKERVHTGGGWRTLWLVALAPSPPPATGELP